MAGNSQERQIYPTHWHELRKFREKVVWNPNAEEIKLFLDTFVKTQDTVNIVKSSRQDIYRELQTRIGHDFLSKLSAATWFIQHSFTQKAMDRSYELTRSGLGVNLPKSIFFYDFACGMYDLTHSLAWAEEVAKGNDIDQSAVDAVGLTVDADSKLGMGTSVGEQTEAYLFYSRRIKRFAESIKSDNSGLAMVNNYTANIRGELLSLGVHIPEFFVAGGNYTAIVYKEIMKGWV